MEMSDNFAFDIAIKATTDPARFKKVLVQYYKEKLGYDDEEARLMAETLIEEAVAQVFERLNEEFKPRKRKAKG